MPWGNAAVTDCRVIREAGLCAGMSAPVERVDARSRQNRVEPIDLKGGVL